MDQIEETVHALLANASLQIAAVRQARVLEEYNKELLRFTAVKEHDWASVSSHLLGLNFLKAATGSCQQLRKAKEKPVSQQIPLHSQ